MPRKRSPVLTDAEARLMNVLWDRGPSTVAEVVAAQRTRPPVAYNTVQTIFKILEDKGFITHEKAGRAFVYRAIMDRRTARQGALGHLVKRLSNDSPSLLVLNLLADERIDPAELKRLKQLIEDA